MGLCYAASVSNSFLESTLFSGENIDVVRQLTVILLSAFFLIRFISLIESVKLKDLKESPAIVPRHDADFAFPTTTLGGIPPEPSS